MLKKRIVTVIFCYSPKKSFLDKFFAARTTKKTTIRSVSCNISVVI